MLWLFLRETVLRSLFWYLFLFQKYKMNNCFKLPLLLVTQFFIGNIFAQAPASMYEQATEASGYIIQYMQDVRAIDYFYGPMSGGGRWGGGGGAKSPEQINRHIKLNSEYLSTLKKADFNKMSIYGKADYVLLRQKIENAQSALLEEQKEQKANAAYVPFADSIYAFEQKRRRGTGIDGEQVAGMMHKMLSLVKKSKATAEAGGKIPELKAQAIASQIDDIKSRLKSAFDFYNGYDPMFTWWAPKSYEALAAGIDDYSKTIRSKSDKKIFNDGSNIGGNPIGKQEMNRLLKTEMIAYNVDDLLRLADQEMEWCRKELLKASREMGFGDDWRAAQEKVKNSYVPAGKQPELIIKLNDDAVNFINQKKLMNLPPLAEETWGMIMMSPERQLVNPFFTGGREISISYPTNTMSHDDKLMSMRGNNPYFSRGTVQHELVPGHHLQFYMNSRYKNYRQSAFNTPFTTEGWTLYWELLLYREGFAKTPEERIGMLFWRMHRCARITFSIKFHIGEWTPKQCVDYLVNEVGHEYANAHGEVKRSFEANYGALYQLAYLVGGLQLFSIHKELVDSGKMTNVQFHDAVIKENHLPMEMLRATLLNQKIDRDYQTQWKFYDFK